VRAARRAPSLSLAFVRDFLAVSSGSGCVMDMDSARSEVQPSAPDNSVENDGYPQIIVETTLAVFFPDVVDRSEEFIDNMLRSGFSILRVSLLYFLCTIPCPRQEVSQNVLVISSTNLG